MKGIVWLGDGPTDTTREHELTDWAEVDAFARAILDDLEPRQDP